MSTQLRTDDAANATQDLHGDTRVDDPDELTITKDAPREYTICVWPDSTGEPDIFRVERVLLNSVPITPAIGTELCMPADTLDIAQPEQGPGDYAWVYVD